MFNTLVLTAQNLAPKTAVFIANTGEEFNPDAVTSGPLGFAIIALCALAVIGLSFPLTRTLRRISYRAEVQQEIRAELAAKEAAAGADQLAP